MCSRFEELINMFIFLQLALMSDIFLYAFCRFIKNCFGHHLWLVRRSECVVDCSYCLDVLLPCCFFACSSCKKLLHIVFYSFSSHYHFVTTKQLFVICAGCHGHFICNKCVKLPAWMFFAICAGCHGHFDM